jgi:hypothetical protein
LTVTAVALCIIVLRSGRNDGSGRL